MGAVEGGEVWEGCGRARGQKGWGARDAPHPSGEACWRPGCRRAAQVGGCGWGGVGQAGRREVDGGQMIFD